MTPQKYSKIIQVMLAIAVVGHLLATPCRPEDKKTEEPVNAPPITFTLNSFRNPFVPALPVKKIIVPEPEAVETQPNNETVESPADEPNIKPEPAIVKSELNILPDVTLPSMEIQGLIWNTPSPQAIVNNRIVAVGESFEGITIVKIHRDGIDVLFKAKEFSVLKDDLQKIQE